MSAKRSARIVGGLYIVGTVAGILSAVAMTAILDDPDTLLAAAGQPNRVLVGALFVMTMAVALAFIPIVMFPILRAQNEAIALGYVIFRSGLEAVVYLAIATGWLVLLPLGQEYAAAGADTAVIRTLGALTVEIGHYLSAVLAVVFSIGAFLFNYLLYRSGIVPRWLSAWGLLAALPYFSSGLLLAAGLIGSTSAILIGLNLPMAVQEMVLAIWLILKGFDPEAIDALGADRATM